MNGNFENYKPSEVKEPLPDTRETLEEDDFENLMSEIRSGVDGSIEERLAALSNEEVDRQIEVRRVNRIYEEARANGRTEFLDPDGSGDTIEVEAWFSKKEAELAKKRREIEEEKTDVLNASVLLNEMNQG